MCRDVGCKNVDHINSLNVYITTLSNVCLAAAKKTIPHTCKRSSSGHIPGWKEYIEPVRQRSIFWHNIWVECGRPRNGYITDIMRKTRSAYHYAIRHIRRGGEQEVINERFANAILNNHSRNFWDEIKRIRSSSKGCSSSVDGVTHGRWKCLKVGGSSKEWPGPWRARRARAYNGGQSVQ